MGRQRCRITSAVDGLEPPEMLLWSGGVDELARSKDPESSLYPGSIRSIPAQTDRSKITIDTIGISGRLQYCSVINQTFFLLV